MAVDKASLDSLRIDRGADAAATAKPWWIAVTAAAVVVIALVVWFLTRPSDASVRVVPARTIKGETKATVLNATGYVTARRAATISSKFTGRVIDVYVDEGLEVKPGQILARLDDSIPRRAMQLAQAQATAAASAINETKVRMEQARIDMQRAASLQTQQIQSKADYDHAKAEFDALQARLAAQHDQLAVAQRQVQLSAQDVEDAVIHAPFGGIVVSKNAQQGEMISPISAGGGFTRTGICTIVDMNSLEIEVDVNEAYIHRVVPNQKVEAVLDAYPDWRIPAHVITVIPTADRQKATVKVRIAFDVKDPRILPDMGVKVAFIDSGTAAAQQHAIVIPKAAIRHDGDQDVVFVANEGRAERRAVKVASTEGDDVKLLSGVSEGERVIVEGPAELKDGEKVKVR
ncbi:MAG TPA: efflux RND transporter periplasmic adaptor subunit [Thermoanaerobaculia bacterium]|nr:efflux RND transporter periplasmic adaptor subunit [Thermoanaerobaculia bacterium]